MKIKPGLVLRCRLCEYRPPADSVLEAFKLHMNVEHDQDEVEMDLVAVCTCGAEMALVETRDKFGDDAHVVDLFRCEPCGNTGQITRKRNPGGTE